MNESNYFYAEMTDIIFILKIFFISIFTYYINLKISNNKISKNRIIMLICIMIVLATITLFINNKMNYFMSIVFIIFSLSIMFVLIEKQNMGYAIIVNSVSLSINYIIFFVSLLISFIPNVIFDIKNDYINLLMILIIDFILLKSIFSIRRLNNGITFIKNKIDNEYFDIIILNISVIIILATAIFNNSYYINKKLAHELSLGISMLAIIMFITIQKTLTMYYKHKKLIEELNETKEELENTKKDRDKVEQENIEISKTNHSISHKIKSLNRKIDKLMMNSEIANEIDLKDTIDKISKEYKKEKVTVELSKTGIELIDDMLDCMKEECIENNIEFELQLSGNIHHMTNNYIPKEELEILLADHIKDAIIAIKHTDNINRSILVRLGLIDEFYSLYMYDSGIEFEIDTLTNLGTKAITTHADEDGTGMGFLNTFDTLNKHKASMVIDEFGRPSKDNYTKVIMIKFDNKNEFKIKSYRAQEIEQKGINNNMQIDIK